MGVAATFEVGIIRVVTCEEPELGMHGRIVEAAYPGLSAESRCIPDQPEGIHSPETEALAIPKIIEVARTAFAKKDAILISCAEDPGIEAVRAAMLDTPVVGGGEAACALAMRYGRRVGVLGITDTAPKAYARMLKENLVGNVRPNGVHSTLDLRTPQGRESCFAAAGELKRMGAQAIALGCTGMASIGIAGEIERAAGIPVIDPVLAMGAVALFEMARRKV